MSFLSTVSHAVHEMSDDGHKLISDARGAIGDIEHFAETLDDDIKDALNALKSKINSLEDHLRRSNIVTKSLHDMVQETEKLADGFAHEVKDAADSLWDDAKGLLDHLLDILKSLVDNDLYTELLHLVATFAKGVMNALITLKDKLAELGKDIEHWLSIDRFIRVWDDIKAIWDEIVHLIEMVPTLIENGVHLEQSAQNWLTVPDSLKAPVSPQGAKQDMTEATTGFVTLITTMAQEHKFPMSLAPLNEASLEFQSSLSLFPDDLFEKIYHAMRLDKVVDFFNKVKDFVTSTDFVKGMRIALAAAASVKYWIKTVPSIISIDADFDLMDFIKGMVNGGDASGVVEGGAGGGTGGGFNLKFKAFSGSGLVINALMLILDFFTALGQFAVDAIPAKS